MTQDSLSAAALMAHVHALADVIGPRPAGSRHEMQAREYVRVTLEESGIEPVEETAFPAPSTWGYGLLVPSAAAFASNALSGLGWLGRLLSGTTTLIAAYSLRQFMGSRKHPLRFTFPSSQSANLVVKIPSAHTARQRVVLIGHLDSNKDRLLFRPELKRWLRLSGTTFIIALGLNALANLLDLKWLRRLSAVGIGFGMAVSLADEAGASVDGANDNASAAACLLGLGTHLQHNPLAQTEVWLAFTGAEEVGCVGMHALLDRHRETLADAWFLDFEMVGTGDIAYVTHHSGLSHFSSYSPDPESVQWALETARRHPEMRVRGARMIITEEIGALRSRGFRGICLVGVGQDGWLGNWHQASDRAANIDPLKLETAARFALAMLHQLDERDVN